MEYAANKRYGEHKPVDAPDWANTLDARFPRKPKQQWASADCERELDREPNGWENPRPVRHVASPCTPHPKPDDCRTANAYAPFLPKYGAERMSMEHFADGSIQDRCPNDCHDYID
jgi:hypothetical protein